MRRIVLALALASPAIASCVLIDAPSNHEARPVGADDFCTRLSEIVCDGVEHCCDQMAVVAMYRNRGMCVSQVQTSCTGGSPNVSALVHDAATGYDPAVAGDVIAEARYRVSLCDVGVPAWINQRTGFLRMFAGSRTPGDSCWTGDLLMSPPQLGNFLACEGEGYSCQFQNASRATCNRRVGSGQQCLDDLDCNDGLYCAPGSIGMPGSCATQLAPGGACRNLGGDHNGWCASGVCRSGQCQAATVSNVYCSATIP